MKLVGWIAVVTLLGGGEEAPAVRVVPVDPAPEQPEEARGTGGAGQPRPDVLVVPTTPVPEMLKEPGTGGSGPREPDAMVVPLAPAEEPDEAPDVLMVPVTPAPQGSTPGALEEDEDTGLRGGGGG